MTKHSWIRIALIFFTPTLISTPAGLVVMHSQLTQFLVAISELHELVPDQENMAYLRKMAEILTARERLSNNDCHLLLEVSISLMKFGRSPGEVDLLIDLKPMVELLGLQKTTIKNIEVRRIAIAAASMLNPEQDPAFFALNMKRNRPDSEEFRQLALESFGCRLDEITFLDLLEELTTQLCKSVKLEENWSMSTCKDEFRQGVALAAQGLADLNNLLDRFAIDRNSKILATSYTLYESREGRQRRVLLETCINRVASTLFDLFLLDQILNLKMAQQKNIILIAGGDHIGALIGSLNRIQAYENLSSYFTGGNPLPLEKLDVLQMPLILLKELHCDTQAKLPLVG